MILDIKGLNVNYGSIRALNNVSLCIDEHEVVALIGNNGAGKTTILKAISGMVPIKAGSIDFCGKTISGKRSHTISRLGITHVPEGRHVFYKFTVRENLLIGAYNLKDRARVSQNMERIMDIFPILRERINQFGGTLSGGEQQMLVIGRALMAEPKLLLLDDPSLGLAPQIVDVIADNIERIAASGIPILLVEQNANLALELSDRAYVIETGDIILEGASSSLRQSDIVQKTYLGIS